MSLPHTPPSGWILSGVSTWSNVVIGVASGLGTGALASWLTPRAQQRADQSGARDQRRREILAGVREMIADSQGADRKTMLVDPRYLAMRAHLKPSVEDQLRAAHAVAVSDTYGTVGNFYLGLLRNEADRLEREWHLS